MRNQRRPVMLGMAERQIFSQLIGYRLQRTTLLSPADSHTSPESSRKREADTNLQESARKKAQSEECQAARDAQVEADEREYERNREAIDAYYLRGGDFQMRKTSDPIWEKMGVWKMRFAKSKPKS